VGGERAERFGVLNPTKFGEKRVGIAADPES